MIRSNLSLSNVHFHSQFHFLVFIFLNPNHPIITMQLKMYWNPSIIESSLLFDIYNLQYATTATNPIQFKMHITIIKYLLPIDYILGILVMAVGKSFI